MRFGHVMVFISDKEKAKKFYSDSLGLDLLDEQERQLVYRMGSQRLVLFETLHDTEPGAYSEEARTVLVFYVEDVFKCFTELTERGVHFLHTKPTENGYAAFVDPFGNVHEILENKEEV